MRKIHSLYRFSIESLYYTVLITSFMLSYHPIHGFQMSALKELPLPLFT